ncbi:glycosyltransferase [Xenorhabdus thailandensis]|uniref:glycosyltransferase n=1 Tax=Xenorhabdus thailandensis TaxID=3136255 RepID=UPI0030F45FE5
MNIIIYATAAVEGGALSMLKDLLNFIKKDNNYYTVCINESIKEDLISATNISYRTIDTKSTYKRIYFDFWGFSNCFDISTYDAVINLQNIPVRTNLPQFLFIHQPIPFSNITFSILSKKERNLLMYKYIYASLIAFNKKYISHCLVQTNWMKDAVAKKIKLNKELIHIIKPDIKIDYSKIDMTETKVNDFIYPAASYSYKNHLILIEAMNILGIDFLDKHNFRLLLTIKRNEIPKLNNLIKNYDLDNYVLFSGHISRDKVLNLIIKSRAMLFPSNLETFGIPLVEAAKLNTYIIASELPYSKEVLNNYNYVDFCNNNDASSWAKSIKSIIESEEPIRENTFHYESGWKKLQEIINTLNSQSNQLY